MYKRILCTAFIALIASALLLTGCGGSGSGSFVPPLLISQTAPDNGDSSVPTSTQISVTFSEAINPASMTTATFQASSPAGPLAGTVSSVGNTSTFHPATAMPTNTLITVQVAKGVRAQSGKLLSFTYTFTFTTGVSGDVTRPTVSSTTPNSGATGVSLNADVVATFSEPMAAATVNSSSFTLQGPGGPVSGSVLLLNNVATLKPNVNLSPNTVYTATVTTAVTDLSNNTLAVNKVWSFTTGVTVDTTAPTVVATDPAASAVGVPINANILATFSEAMDAPTITTTNFVLKNAGNIVPATVSYSSNIATLNPSATLAPNTVYTASISTAVTDTEGNHLANTKSWTFTTASTVDVTPPTVVSTTPANGATNVFLNASVNATFSEAMRPNTISTSTFSVVGVTGTVTYDSVSHIATFKPISDLAANTTYTARLETGGKDASGNGLANPKIWTFTTGNQHSQTVINLGSASTYAVLAGSTVTNGGPTIVNGDLGVSPGSAVTGFPPGKVNGAIHAGDAAASQAKTDLLAGQLDAAGRLGAVSLPADLSGLTFTPGLYKNSISVMLSAGSVTLDAQGDANAVFIFQMGTTLTTGTGTHVVLAGGAKASNVYWSVGSSATLGVNSIFKGIVLAEASITVNTGAVSDGVFLTKTGAVTLESNTVTRGLVIRH